MSVLSDSFHRSCEGVNLSRTYASGTSIDTKIGQFDGDGNASWYLRDHLNSTTAIIGNDGSVQNHYTSNAWGQSLHRFENVQNRYTFTGREEDKESGFMHFRARSYFPSIGRFMQRDPKDRYGQHYLYTSNNPIRRIDPMGKDWISKPLEWLGVDKETAKKVEQTVENKISSSVTEAKELAEEKAKKLKRSAGEKLIKFGNLSKEHVHPAFSNLTEGALKTPGLILRGKKGDMEKLITSFRRTKLALRELPQTTVGYFVLKANETLQYPYSGDSKFNSVTNAIIASRMKQKKVIRYKKDKGFTSRNVIVEEFPNKLIGFDTDSSHGVSFGRLVLIHGNPDVKKKSGVTLLEHEIGHSFQSKRTGPFYLPIVLSAYGVEKLKGNRISESPLERKASTIGKQTHIINRKDTSRFDFLIDIGRIDYEE